MVLSVRSKGSRRERKLLPIDQALERKRLALKLSMRAAAECVGVSHTNFQNWVTRGSVPHQFFLPQIATFLEATIEDAERMRALMCAARRAKDEEVRHGD